MFLFIFKLIIYNFCASAFAQQCLCREAEEMCVIEDADNKKISAIYEIDKEIYLCIILPRFNTKDAGTLINEVNTLHNN